MLINLQSAIECKKHQFVQTEDNYLTGNINDKEMQLSTDLYGNDRRHKLHKHRNQEQLMDKYHEMQIKFDTDCR